MGILGTILSRVGIPLALIAVAGLVIFRFKDPILSAVSGGAQTIGTAITTPFGALLQGIQTGFSNIPETIDITFPSFNFGFAEGADPGGDAGNVPAITEEGFDFDQALVNLCRNSGGILCFGESRGNGDGGDGGGDGDGGGGASASSLTPFEPERKTFFDESFDILNRARGTRAEVIAQFPGAIGLFDLLSTGSRTERVPLTLLEARAFGTKQIRLSSQLFEEFGSVGEIFG